MGTIICPVAGPLYLEQHHLPSRPKFTSFPEAKLIFSFMVKANAEIHTTLGNMLMGIYSKFASFQDVNTVFESIPERDVFTWNIMIGLYCRYGCLNQALSMFREMQQEGIVPDKFTLTGVIKICSSLGCFETGKLVHAHISKGGFELDAVMGSAILSMYGKCGSLEDACQAFSKIEIVQRDVVVWTTLIAAYIKSGHEMEAFQAFQEMKQGGSSPNKITFLIMLNICYNSRYIACGRWLHACILNREFSLDLALANALVSMYGRCGSVKHAYDVFIRIPKGNVITWTAIIVANVQNGQAKGALTLFHLMQLDNILSNNVTFMAILDACSNMECLANGKLVHAYIRNRGIECDTAICNALVNMYGKCGNLINACWILNRMLEQNVISWTSIIAVYAENGHAKAALQCFRDMQMGSLIPDKVTFIHVLAACYHSLPEGKFVHASIVGIGCQSDLLVGASLVTMYGHCGDLSNAFHIYEKVHMRIGIIEAALIAACIHNGVTKEAMQLFHKMVEDGTSVDHITFNILLDASARVMIMGEGKWLHSFILTCGPLDVMTQNLLLNMYGKFGRLKEAKILFDGMEDRDVFSWTTMVGMYSQVGFPIKAIEIFQEMLSLGTTPNTLSFVCALEACANLPLLIIGDKIHAQTLVNRFDLDVKVGNAVLSMFGNSGRLAEAQRVFDRMPERNAISWTTMIIAYSINGHGKEAVQLFQYMSLEGIMADGITFVGMFSACKSAGLLNMACHKFVSMGWDPGITQTIEHYGCVSELIGQMGWINEAEDLISSLPFLSTTKLWTTLLASSRIHNDSKWGGIIGKKIFSN